jgi:hypothetical protein
VCVEREQGCNAVHLCVFVNLTPINVLIIMWRTGEVVCESTPLWKESAIGKTFERRPEVSLTVREGRRG